MDGSREPRIRIQRSVSVTLGAARPGSSSSHNHHHHHTHHLHSGGRPRTSSWASMPSAVVESGGGNMGRQRSLSHGKPSQPLMDNDIYGRDTFAVTTRTTTTTTAPRRTESTVPPSPGDPVLPRHKAHEATVRMIAKQQREVQEIRDLADFLRNRTPPPGNVRFSPLSHEEKRGKPWRDGHGKNRQDTKLTRYHDHSRSSCPAPTTQPQPGPHRPSQPKAGRSWRGDGAPSSPSSPCGGARRTRTSRSDGRDGPRPR